MGLQEVVGSPSSTASAPVPDDNSSAWSRMASGAPVGASCAVGEGDCNGADDACALGLRCMDDAGPLWELAEGVHVCEFPTEAENEGPLP